MPQVSHPGALLERGSAFQAVERLLGEAARGHGGMLSIVGDAGIGKTTLLEAARRQAKDMGLQLGSGHGDPAETALPFGVMHQAVTAVRGDSPLATLADTSPANAGVTDARAALFYAVVRWLEGVAHAPILLAVDDLHWADADSLALLGVVARRLERLPIGIIVTMRPWPPAALDAMQSMRADGRVSEERLHALSYEAAGELLDRRARREVDSEMHARAWQLTAGNPLLLEQAALLVEREGELPQPGQGEYELLTPRFAGLPEHGRRFAQAAAVFGLRFRGGVAGHLAGVDDSDIDEAVAALATNGLIRAESEDHLEFVHPLFQQALYDSIPMASRQRMHARAFGILEELGARAEAAEQAVLGDLFGNAAAIGTLEGAGTDALRSGAVSTACRLLRGSVRLAGERASPAQLMTLAESEVLAGHPTTTMDLCHRILSGGAVTSSVRMNALRMLGRAHFYLGEIAESDRRYEEAVAGSADELVTVAAEVSLEHATVSLFAGGPLRSLPLALRARATAATSAATPVIAAADLTWGLHALLSGDPAGLDAARQGADVVMSQGLTDRAASLAFFGSAAICAEDFDAATEALTTAYRWVELSSDPVMMGLIATTHASSLLRQGLLTDAMSRAAGVRVLADMAPGSVPFAAALESEILLHLGRTEESAARAAVGQRLADERQEWLPTLWLHLTAMRQALRGARVTEATAHADATQTLADELGIIEPCLVPWAGAAMTAYAAAGRVEALTAVIDRMDSVRQLRCGWPLAMAHRGRALIADIASDDNAAAHHWEAALAVPAPLPLERIELLTEYGGYWRRRGQLVRARPLLAEAVATADGAGARWLGAAAAEELRLAGGRRRRRSGGSELTAAESRVARLAGEGLSNAEIAGQLFVSGKTVDTHLQHVYSKLGINSRRELMRRTVDTTGSD